ncbi:MAG: FG-GAP-like repeat-containing protein [Candidatus Thiosymbion ectosymbiont of Robbea hypermnestra]|nr:FG-GAP-like repeat-containing protein [Candidatus Thiosymbion ectosymbiont of Robbea hypermnestra]
MKTSSTLALGVTVGLLLAAAVPIPAAGGDGNAQKAAASVFRENPKQRDPTLELQRLRNEGIALYESGIALDDALTAFERAFALSGAAADAFNIAVVHFKRNDPRATKGWLERALALDADFPNAHYLMGVLARSEGDFESAKQHWERTREIAPDDGHLHYQLALLARSERNEAAFIQSLINALALEPDNTAALYQMSRYYQNSGNKELAKETWDRFNALKKREKFSRREKSKDPGRLSRPVLARSTGAKGFEVIEVAPAYAVIQADPGCEAVAADRSVARGESPTESIAVACRDGRLLRMDWADSATFTAQGRVPPDSRDLRIEWFDGRGPRVLALTDAGLSIAEGLVGEATEYAAILPAAKAPVVLADLDADGDIDIAAGGNRLPLTNAGKLQFVQEKALYKTGPVPDQLEGAKAAVVADLQRDGQSDLLILRDDALVVVVGTPDGLREALRVTAGAGASDLVVGDFSNDGRLDVALLGPESIRMVWNLDALATAAAVATTDLEQVPGGPRRAVATDFNNDGLLDLVVVTAGGTIAVLRNQGNQGFSVPSTEEWPQPATGARIIPTDFDRDGREDLAYVTERGKIAIARNVTEGVGNAIALFANGVRAAPSGLLTQIEVRRGAGYAYVQSPGAVQRIGIGGSDYVEILRLEWTNGFIENKLKIDAAPTVYSFKESERISGSCPSLFVWNGEGFDYLTDAFISGPMGVPLDRGIYFPVKDRELILIPGERVRLRDGRLEIRFTEELRETVFLDRVRLLVVDHPQGTEILPHSRLAPVPAPAEPFYVARDLLAPARARGSDGSDLTVALARVDGVHADFLTRSPHAGFAAPHWIELELPEAIDPAAVDAVLATGWFYYFESTSMIAQAQRNGPDLPWPYLQQFVAGSWQDVAPLGVPSGKGKTLVAPVKGRLASRRLRIRSGISVYWDRIAFSPASAPPPVANEAPLVESMLRFRGFSQLVSHDPERFDYHNVRYSSPWSPMRGRFTAYGPAEGLIASADGRYAVFGSGDEISFSFAVDRPAPASSRTRSFLLELVGYVKDGDRYTGHAGRVEPVPYLGLDQYPPPQDDRLQAAQTRSPYRTRAPLDFTLATISR